MRRTPAGVETYWDYTPTGQAAALHTPGLTTGATTELAIGHTIAFGYDPASREIERHLGGVTLRSTWDQNSRLTVQRLTAGALDGQELTAQELTAQELTGGLAADAFRTGPVLFEPEPAGSGAKDITDDLRSRYGQTFYPIALTWIDQHQ